ncbi:MAG: hypothetical protein Kow0089_05340 [Desulfobulbaceae bacterium]
MESVKQYLFDRLVDEFNNKPGFLLARTLFLFCYFNPGFEMPGNIKKAFIDGLMEDEVRAFSLRYGSGGTDTGEDAAGDEASLAAQKKEILREIAAETLTRGTGKTYSPHMVEKIATRYRGLLSYNEILETIILSAHRKL